MIVTYDSENNILTSILKPYPPGIIDSLKSAGTSFFISGKRTIKDMYIEINEDGIYSLAPKKHCYCSISTTDTTTEGTITLSNIEEGTVIYVENFDSTNIYTSTENTYSFSITTPGTYTVTVDIPKTRRFQREVKIS